MRNSKDPVLIFVPDGGSSGLKCCSRWQWMFRVQVFLTNILNLQSAALTFARLSMSVCACIFQEKLVLGQTPESSSTVNAQSRQQTGTISVQIFIWHFERNTQKLSFVAAMLRMSHMTRCWPDEPTYDCARDVALVGILIFQWQRSLDIVFSWTILPFSCQNVMNSFIIWTWTLIRNLKSLRRRLMVLIPYD